MRLAELSDNELVPLACQDAEEAFTELLARHDGRVFQVALTMLRDSYDDACDAMQEARIATAESLNRFDSSLGAFRLSSEAHSYQITAPNRLVALLAGGG